MMSRQPELFADLSKSFRPPLNDQKLLPKFLPLTAWLVHAAQKKLIDPLRSRQFSVFFVLHHLEGYRDEHKQRRQQKCIADLRTVSAITKSFYFAIRYRADCRCRTERVKSWNAQAITRDDLSSRIKLVSEAREVFNAIGIDGRLNFS